MRIKYFKTQSLLNMKRVIKFIFLITIILFSACKNNKDAFDATGTFEADEIIVSAVQKELVQNVGVGFLKFCKANDLPSLLKEANDHAKYLNFSYN